MLVWGRVLMIQRVGYRHCFNFHLPSLSFPKNTLIVSHTSVNTDPPGTGGIKTPNTPHLIVSNVTFVNFDSSFTSCLRACSHCKLFQGGFQVWLEKLKFLGGSENCKTSYQWEHEVRGVHYMCVGRDRLYRR